MQADTISSADVLGHTGDTATLMLGKLTRRLKALIAGEHGNSGDSVTPADLPELPEDDLRLAAMDRKFSRELFARLLTELPKHRQAMARARADGNDRRLRDCVHQLLGAVAYCDAPELEKGLRELRLALRTGESETIRFYYERAINVIDGVLRMSGYREP